MVSGAVVETIKHWVLLRGLMREKLHWGPFVQTLAQEFPEAQVHCLDLPGNGVENHRVSPLTVSETARWAREQTRALQGPVGLIAISLGAMVATEWVDQNAENVAVMVLINSSFRNLSPFWRRLRPQNYRRLLQVAMMSPGPSRERLILTMTTAMQSDLGQVSKLWADQGRPVSRANAFRQLVAAALYRRRRQGAPPVPALILASHRDQLVHCRCSQAIAADWNASMYLHPNAGHDLPLDDGRWVCQHIHNWMSESAKRAR